MPAPLLVRLDVARRKALLVLLEHLPLVLVADVLARLVQRLVDASERVRVVARLEADCEPELVALERLGERSGEVARAGDEEEELRV